MEDGTVTTVIAVRGTIPAAEVMGDGTVTTVIAARGTIPPATAAAERWDRATAVEHVAAVAVSTAVTAVHTAADTIASSHKTHQV